MRATGTSDIDQSRTHNDPRLAVAFFVAGTRWRIHPGDFDHPVLLLRQIAETARAMDDAIEDRFGFTATDLLEVVLAHGDNTVQLLAESWPKHSTVVSPDTPQVSNAEIQAISQLEISTDLLVDACSDPGRAELALHWLTREASQLRVRHERSGLVFGPALRWRRGEEQIWVPACLTLGVITAGVEALAKLVDDDPKTTAHLQTRTLTIAADLLSRQLVVRSRATGDLPDGLPIIDNDRLAVAIVSGLTQRALSGAISWGHLMLAGRAAESAAPRTISYAGSDRVNVILYGGPARIALHAVGFAVLIHVEELAEVLAETDGDLVTLTCFLEDLGHHHGYTDVAFVDILDVWWAWNRHGQLGLPTSGIPRTGLFVQPYLHDPTWGSAASWEPFDAILTAAGLTATHFDWPTWRLDGNDGVDLFCSADGPAVFVNVNPPLVIDVDLAQSSATTSGDFLVGFADCLRLHLRRPEISEYARLADGTPLTISLMWLPAGAFDAAGGGVTRFGADPERGQIILAFAADVRDEFAGDGMAGHTIVGDILYEAVTTLRALREESPGPDITVFHTVWNAAGPLLTTGRKVESVPQRIRVNHLTRSPAVRARVSHSVAAEVRALGSPSGTFVGPAAHDICQNYILPAIGAVLDARIARLNHTLLWIVATRLNDAHASQNRRTQQTRYAMDSPWAANWHAYATDDEQAVSAHSLETLFETLLASPPSGPAIPDQLAVAEVTALAHLLAMTAATSRGFTDRVHGLQVTVDDGIFVVEPATDEDADQNPEAEPLGVDFEAYQQALLASRVAPKVLRVAGNEGAAAAGESKDAAQQPVLGQRQLNEFTPVYPMLPDLLKAVDDGLRAGWGTGLDGIRAVLGTAEDWPTDDIGIIAVEHAELVDAVVTWSQRPAEEVKAAIAHLTLTGEQLCVAGPHRFLEVERREHRLALRPLPVVDGQIWILPWRVTQTQELFAGYLDHARLPYLRGHLPDPTLDDLTIRYRQAFNNDLEDIVRGIVEDLGLPHCHGPDEADLRAAGIDGPRGEIDLLIADPSSRRLWVCEVKDPVAAFSTATIRGHVRKFYHGKKPYVPKLIAKAEQIAANSRAAAQLCGVADDGEWRVIPLLLTRRVEPAAFVRRPRVSFVLPHQLAAVLTASRDPAAGPVPD